VSKEKPKLRLTGADGNAFMLLGLASRAMKKAGWSEEKRNVVMDEAKSGNYNHLLQTLMKYFDVS